MIKVKMLKSMDCLFGNSVKAGDVVKVDGETAIELIMKGLAIDTSGEIKVKKVESASMKPPEAAVMPKPEKKVVDIKDKIKEKK